MRWIILFSLGACASGDQPTWAASTVSFQARDAVVDGSLTWEYYAEGWSGQLGGRALLCSAVFPLHGDAVETCSGCTQAWEVRLGEPQTDCDTAQLDALPQILGFGLGPLVSELGTADGSGTDGGYVQLASQGWIAHGWSHPGEGGMWTLEPAWAWTREELQR